MQTVKLGTRGSQLALFQARAVAALLQARADVACELVVIRTSGDRLADAPLSDVGGKRLFVKELEDALLEGAVDLAVHSSKDMPAVLPDGLVIGAALPREDPLDAVVLASRHAGGAPPPLAVPDLVRRLDRAPRIGTGSVRRTAQLLPHFPGATFVPIRGNLDTRLRKLDAEGFDALVLAAAGLKRLGHHGRISATLPAAVCTPAPGQGIIAVELRGDRPELRRLVDGIDDRPAATALLAERAVVTRLGGGCQMPLGAYASMAGATLSLSAVVVSLDGRRALRAEVQGSAADPEALGTEAADRLLAQGAAALLAESDGSRAPVEGLQP